ncbi:7242_t:CDS:2 [Rhizophagus irregularis]|nr:7242_t:CDS:2 [Rhizophagus irregularis]
MDGITSECLTQLAGDQKLQEGNKAPDHEIIKKQSNGFEVPNTNTVEDVNKLNSEFSKTLMT